MTVPLTPEQSAVIRRVRSALPPGAAVREVSMFGSRAVMLEERMLVAAGKDGSLLVRVDPARGAQLCARPGAAPAVMGTGRPMGTGWITVEPAALAAEEDLAGWLEEALAFHAGSG
ncbi:TfoX/Sxy family protein [Brachybacterium phenoliresistens]|uniref:TfoX/Sxy family protein n=1 Tax=Brachybacterium phenoliresistens TaxID=396014 RepID=UPI0004ADF87B|nr:TfoX/Sxy family protein [Brachybacterium phenoliresistens]